MWGGNSSRIHNMFYKVAASVPGLPEGVTGRATLERLHAGRGWGKPVQISLETDA